MGKAGEEAAAPTVPDCKDFKVEAFSDKDCATAVTDTVTADNIKAAGATFNVVPAENAKCVNDVSPGTGSSKITCNADGYGKAIFKDADCATAKEKDGKAVVENAMTWGKCYNFDGAQNGILSVKVTGANAMVAGAAAALAFVASQF